MAIRTYCLIVVRILPHCTCSLNKSTCSCRVFRCIASSGCEGAPRGKPLRKRRLSIVALAWSVLRRRQCFMPLENSRFLARRILRNSRTSGVFGQRGVSLRSPEAAHLGAHQTCKKPGASRRVHLRQFRCTREHYRLNSFIITFAERLCRVNSRTRATVFFAFLFLGGVC